MDIKKKNVCFGAQNHDIAFFHETYCKYRKKYSISDVLQLWQNQQKLSNCKTNQENRRKLTNTLYRCFQSKKHFQKYCLKKHMFFIYHLQIIIRLLKVFTKKAFCSSFFRGNVQISSKCFWVAIFRSRTVQAVLWTPQFLLIRVLQWLSWR